MLHLPFKQAFIKTLALATICLTTFSFTSKPGGDVYQIYLNDKLILKQYSTQPLTMQSLQLTKANINDQLVIYYSHCGTVGKGRTIAIKTEKGTVLKEWKFADTNGSINGMVIPVKELLQLEKIADGTQLSIYYASQQLPAGRMLTSI